MPIITFAIGYTLPGGVALYWFLSTFTTAAQQKFLYSQDSSDEDQSSGEDSEKIDQGSEDNQDSEEGSSDKEKADEDEEVIEGEIVD